MEPLAQNSMVNGRYLVVQVIGSGPTGEVYLAVDQWSGTAVALKRTVGMNAGQANVERLLALRHAILPKVNESFFDDSSHFLVTEHISGDTMERRLEDAGKPFPVSWCMFWADQVLDALNYMHMQSPPIVHGDVKPANLKLTDENHMVLLDHTLAAAAKNGESQQKADPFTPLEQLRGDVPTPAGDIYAVSATIYTLMTGVTPPDARKRSDSVRSGLPDPLASPAKVNPAIAGEISDVLLQGLDLSPEKRYRTAAEMQRELRRAFKRSKEAPAGEPADMRPQDEPTAVMDIGEMAQTAVHPEAPTVAATSPGTELPTRTNYSSKEEPEPTAILPEAAVSVPPRPDAKTEAFSTNTAASAVTEVAPPSPHSMPPPRPAVTPPTASAAVRRQPAAKRSRAGLIVGILAALVLLGGIGAAGAWFAYTRYYKAAALPSPTPSPEVAPSPVQQVATEITPAATPQVTETIDVNANKPVITNTPSQVKVNPVAPAKTNPAKTTQAPVAKPPAKSKSGSDRTDILQ